MVEFNTPTSYTHAEFRQLMTIFFDMQRMDEVPLNVQNCSTDNKNSIIEWAKQDGFYAEVIDDSYIRISKFKE